MQTQEEAGGFQCSRLLPSGARKRGGQFGALPDVVRGSHKSVVSNVIDFLRRQTECLPQLALGINMVHMRLVALEADIKRTRPEPLDVNQIKSYEAQSHVRQVLTSLPFVRFFGGQFLPSTRALAHS